MRASDRSSRLVISNAGRTVSNEVSAGRTGRTTVLSEVASQARIASLVDIVAGDTGREELRAGEADISHEEGVETAGCAGDRCSCIVKGLAEGAVSNQFSAWGADLASTLSEGRSCTGVTGVVGVVAGEAI